MMGRSILLLLLFVFISSSLAVNPCVGVTTKNAMRLSSTKEYIQSMNYPQNYPDDADCKWLIQTPGGNFVNLEVIFMDLVNWGNSCSDSLTVYDGLDETYPVLHKYCGMDKTMVRSTGQTMFLVFRSDKETNKRGFQLQYWSNRVFDSSCNVGGVREIGVEIDLPIYVQFPDYVGHNINNADCRYRFVAPLGNKVVAVVVDWKKNEALGTGFLAIRSGYNTSGTIMMVHRQSSMTAPFSYLVTDDRYLWLHTHIEQRDWSSHSDKVIIKFMTAPSLVDACDGNGPVVIRSSALPALMFYPCQKNKNNNKPCPLKFKSHSASANVRVDVIRTLGVTDYSVLSCTVNDYLKVFNGETTAAAQLMQKCRNNIPTYISTAPSVVIDQNTNHMLDYYLIKAVSNDFPCNGKAKELIVSENLQVEEDILEGKIPNNGHCVYHLKASKSTNVVSLSLTGNLGYNLDSTCSKDYIIVYDGDSWKSPELGRWCGASMKPFTSSGRSMTLILISDEIENTQLRVKAQFFGFTQGGMCEELTELVGSKKMSNITSPGFPSNYPLNSNCKWVISTRIYNFIVWFVVHESRLDDKCKDLVYVYDGMSTEHDDLIGRFCSKDTPTFKSTKGSMTIVFQSDGTRSMKGFKAGYYVEHVRGKNVNEGPPVGLIAGICIAIAVAGALILILYIACCRSKNDDEKDHEHLVE